MPKKPKKEKIAQRYFTWLLGLRDGVYYADGRTNAPPAGRHSLGTKDYEQAREALKQLVAEGLAVFIKNCGIVVSELSPKVAWELTEYRCLIEGQMARWAVPMMTDRGSENTAAEHGISR